MKATTICLLTFLADWSALAHSAYLDGVESARPTCVSMLIVISKATAGNCAWREVADGLRAKHADMRSEVSVVDGSVTNCLGELRRKLPRYVAFVMTPEEARFATVLALRKIMREVDDDPFDDAIWGIVSGPTAGDALRIATSAEPKRIEGALTTTGFDASLYPGEGVTLSDGNPPGRWLVKDAQGGVTEHSATGSLTRVFVDAWNRIDPQILVTSSHARQFDLTIPFGRGLVVPRNGRFAGIGGEAFSPPRREKVWIAAGNCLIADNAPGENMVMTALGFGKVNQFVGYTVPTWFGDVGWNTLGYATRLRLPVNEAYYFANQHLNRRLANAIGERAKTIRPDFTGDTDVTIRRLAKELLAKGVRPDRNVLGFLWDRDGTVFWGDPAQRLGLDSAVVPQCPGNGSGLPLGIVFDKAQPNRRLKRAPDGFEVFVADDFALVTKWPALKTGWRRELVFE